MHKDLDKMSDAELLELKKQIEYDISKYNNYQHTKKIQLNSAYGALGSGYFRYFSIPLAEAVTKCGQYVIQHIAKDINQYMNKLLHTNNEDYVLGADTDSIYLSLESVIKKIAKDKDIQQVIELMDRFCEKKVQDVINKSCESLAEYLNVYQQKMVMKREALADKGLWTAKKKYALNVHDLEGVRFTTPVLKVMGLEAVKSSYPEICRSKIKETLRLIMDTDNDTVINFINQFREEFYKMSPEEIGYSTSVSHLRKYMDAKGNPTKGAPYNTKSAIAYNKLLTDKNLTNTYEEIKEGDKIKILPLKSPNPVGVKDISFKDFLPREFVLEKFIDYDSQFEKVYLNPIKAILDAISWDSEYINSLEFV